MVDAFIKYCNLLNGLWQSHWRSLFRCRWLPPYWLPLSLVQPPVREKRRKLPPVSTDNLSVSDSQSLSLSVCIWDWLPVYTHSQLPLVHTISLSLCINSPLMQQKGDKPSLRSVSMNAQRLTWSCLSSWWQRKMWSWLKETVTGLQLCLSFTTSGRISFKHNCHS